MTLSALIAFVRSLPLLLSEVRELRKLLSDFQVARLIKPIDESKEEVSRAIGELQNAQTKGEVREILRRLANANSK